jgi:iron(III) transport system ATP-binding protein
VTDLQCVSVAKRFGDRAVLTDVNLTVPAGSITAILGSSGSGKTTLLRIVMGFIRADAGQVRIGGSVVVDAPGTHVVPQHRGIGYVAQEGALFPHLSVGQNVGFGLPRSTRKSGERIAEVLTLVGLSGADAGRRPNELSGGEQRRVSLARALAPRPKLVLLDEPFSALDASLRVETRAAVVRALTEEGTTGVLVTHDQAEALSMGSQVAVLRHGELVQTATPRDLYQTPVDLRVAQFVGEAVVLPGQADRGMVECALGRLQLLRPATGPVLVMLRPEQIHIEANGAAPDGSAAGDVVSSAYFGGQTLVTLRLRGGDGLCVTAATTSQDPPADGTTVRVAVRGSVMAYPTLDRDGTAAPGRSR